MIDTSLDEAVSTWAVVQSEMYHIIKEETRMALRERFASPEQFNAERHLTSMRSLDRWQRLKAAYLENRDTLLKHRSDIIRLGEMNYAKFRERDISYIDMLEQLMHEEMEKSLLL